MKSKVNLKKLVVKGFRGAIKEIWIDFENNTKNLVLFGNNGDGKSSFSDAIEWFFTDKIDYLQREVSSFNEIPQVVAKQFPK